MTPETKKIVLQSLNNDLKYGKELMMQNDEDDINMAIEIWRKNESIELAIKEIESL